MISVVVCTYNRADLLHNVLQTLCEQSLDRDQYEVIVVDNNSTDQTKAVVEIFMQSYSNVQYCLETKVGLSHARNRGWQEARGEYVAYTDDDCRIPEEWLSVALEIIRQKSPAIFGGPYYPFYMTNKPYWFKDIYGSWTLTTEARHLRDNEFIHGGNIFLQRNILKLSGGFDPSLGMAGQQIAYGEESELQIRIRTTIPGQLFYYDPRLYVLHLVRSEKMTLRWRARAAIGKGYSSNILISDDKLPSLNRLMLLLKVIKVLVILGFEATYGTVRRDRQLYPYVENYLYECALWRLRGLGILQHQFDLLKKIQNSSYSKSYK